MLSGMIIKICMFKKFCRADERKKLLFHLCFLILFQHTDFFPFFFNMAYMRIRLISVVTKNLKKIVHRLEAEILEHKVANMEKKVMVY